MEKKSMLERLQEILDTPEGKARAKAFFDEKVNEGDTLEKLKTDFFDPMTNAEFEAYVIAQVALQPTGYEDDLTPEVSDIVQVMLRHGKELTNYTQWRPFETQRTSYKGLRFSLLQGQGCVYIINKGKKNLLWI